VKEIAVGYEKSFIGQKTYDIDNAELEKLDKYGTDNNCANFQTSILDATGQFDKAEYDSKIGCSPDDRCSIFEQRLTDMGYSAVSKEEAQEGDVWIKIKSNGAGHTEMVSGKNENGDLTFVGSNNITQTSDIQKVSERTKSDAEIAKGNFYHKDFSEEELNKISEKIEDGSIADYAKEKLNDPSLSAEQRETLEELLSDISDFESGHNDLERLSRGEYTKGEQIWASYYNKVAH
ncbi:hypothetical protein IJJ97_03070, partial [bacterium]|nr:hypothetical protein [bacterium]